VRVGEHVAYRVHAHLEAERAEQLGDALLEAGLARACGISRHLVGHALRAESGHSWRFASWRRQMRARVNLIANLLRASGHRWRM
jgi:hypothetical protein